MEKRSLSENLKKLTQHQPQRVSIVDRDGSHLTARQLQDTIERCAFQLEASAPDSKFVILLAAASANYYAWSLAILGRGRTLVPIDSSWPAARIERVVKEIRIADPRACVIRAEDPLQNDGKCSADIVLEPDDPAVVLFTSGTTGKPKGVILSYGFLLSQETDLSPEQIQASSQRSHQDEGSIYDALFHYASISTAVHLNYMVALARGHTILCSSGAQALNVARSIETFARYQPRRILLTPSLCERLLDFPNWFSTFREINLFGETVSPGLQKRLQDEFPEAVQIHDLYGQTEVAIWMARKDLRKGHAWRGRSEAGVTLREGQLCAIDPFDHTIFLGYLGEGARTPGVPFLTGDLAKGDIDSFRLGGRMDNMRKVRGFRVELNETELALSELTQSPNAAEVFNDQLVAFVSQEEVPEPAHDFEKRIKSGMREKLPEYQVPDRIILIDEIPLNQSLKVDRDRLVELIKEAGAGQEAVSKDPTVRLFQTLFPFAKNITDQSSFSDLGGHSLLLLKAMSQLREDGLEGLLSPAQILKLDTVNEIRRALNREEEPSPGHSHGRVAPICRALTYRPPVVASRHYPKMVLRHAQHVNHIAEATRVDIPVDASIPEAQIQKALEKLVMAHPVLRTRGQRKGLATVPQPSEAPVSMAGPASSGLLPWGWKKGEPLFRATRLPNGSMRLIVHHGISDHESCRILARDFSALLSGSELSPRPYQNLERVQETLEALPRRCPYSVPGGHPKNTPIRWNRAFALDFAIDEAFLLPSLVLSFARAWKGPIEVPVYMDARTAPHLLDVDATQLVSFLVVSRSARAKPEMPLSAIRNQLDTREPEYYRGLSYRGLFGDIMTRDRIGPSPRERIAYGQGDIVLNVLESGGQGEQPDRMVAIPATISELRNPDVASIYAEYYMDTQRLFINACGPTETWLEDLADTIRKLASEQSA